MHPQAYRHLHVVKLSRGRWAACCQGCGRTVAICATKPAAWQRLTDHLEHAPTGQEVRRP